MSVLVIAEHNNSALLPATAHAVSAAAQLSADVHLLVVGCGVESVVAAAASFDSVTTVLVADNKCYQDQLAESLAPLIAKLAPAYSHILAAATTTGKNLLPRAAALADSQPISDIIAVHSDDTFQRLGYAGNIVTTVQSLEPVRFITVRVTAFDAAEQNGSSGNIISVNDVFEPAGVKLVARQLRAVDRQLTSADRVVSGGRGIQSEENFALLNALADKLDAAVGASRGAVDSGFASNDMQVGQTGKIIAPDLYVAIGISGAIQHLAGMKESKVIVAVNSDENAPIFQVADYGLVADLFTAVPELIQALDAIDN